MVTKFVTPKELLLKEERVFLWEKYHQIMSENEDFFYDPFPKEKLNTI